MSHAAADAGAPGALVLHGFTSHPASVRGLADAFVADGFHVELPLLAGHGTAMEDLLDMGWADWYVDASAAYERLAARSPAVIVAGLSMGGALAMRLALDHPEIAGVVAINPVAQGQAPEVIGLLGVMIDAGTEVMDGVGGDVADPDVGESAYAGTPLRALRSLLQDGVAVNDERYPSATVPMLLLNSPQDHVVDPAQAEHVAGRWGGRVERVTLERSFHVATVDYDKELINESALAFGHRVAAR